MYLKYKIYTLRQKIATLLYYLAKLYMIIEKHANSYKSLVLNIIITVYLIL